MYDYSIALALTGGRDPLLPSERRRLEQLAALRDAREEARATARAAARTAGVRTTRSGVFARAARRILGPSLGGLLATRRRTAAATPDPRASARLTPDCCAA